MKEYTYRSMKAGWMRGEYFFLEVGRYGFQVEMECRFREWRRWDFYLERMPTDLILHVGPGSFALYRYAPTQRDFAV
ncbi:hypothetical protein J2Y48_000475 [Mycoplana sp. BE70]|uniref:hypothetical protein n=1 Tax=Mycoplana sp. BE70 TaxID=2817775 RepID=UPI00285992FC|nr:hypothetical protein [Mycoplana sp. BE70]MDR6755202.1 hypothetical protein [Mycoplana sp. BE70]